MLAFGKRHPLAAAGILASAAMLVGAEAWVARKPELPPAVVWSAVPPSPQASAASGASGERGGSSAIGQESAPGPLARPASPILSKPAEASYSPADFRVAPAAKTYTAAEPETPPAASLASIQPAPRQASPPLATAEPPPLAPLPLALQAAEKVAPEALTPAQADALAELQDKFTQAIGGPAQDPQDPAYLQRWMLAQHESDQEFRLLFGDTAFLGLELQTNNNQ